ncbi:hypothetical protein [Nonomuraea rubra]|uniref:hypothetical protein n=1 Tax=Nonomuraea rubra TaxID=46180 RepID=UPI0034113728
MSLPGCGTSIRLEAGPVAVREASAVGTVMARTTQELLYENTVQVIHVMIVDVGEDNFADALSSVSDQLRERGWVENSVGPTHLDMSSTKWEEVHLRAGFPSLLPSFPAEKHADIRKALKDTVDGTYAYPMIELIKSNP